MVDALFPFLATLFAASGLGYMLFFAFGVAPLVFTQLSEADAGRLIRRLFPIYYGVGVVLFLAAAASAFGHWSGLVLAAVALGFAYAWQVLMPQINRLRDAQLEGDAAAGQQFERLHRASVALNGFQLVAIAAALFGLGTHTAIG